MNWPVSCIRSFSPITPAPTAVSAARASRLAPVWVCAVAVLTLSACSSTPVPAPTESVKPSTPTAAKPRPGGGGYYLDDGPGDNPPPNIHLIPDAIPRVEPLHRFANRPYNVFGRDYVPMTELRPYRARGVASWYGRRYHGQNTSSGEVYDMYGMTAAHPTLPIPSYVRVTNPVNGRSVVLRVNDRGPFKHDRLIDLSYTAAYKLDYVQKGSTEVEVELILPGVNASSAHPVAIGGGLHQAQPLPPLPSVTPSGPVLGAGQLFLQLGVFSSRDNADRLMQRLRTEMPSMASRARVLQEGAQFRVHIGPWNREEEARQAAEQLGRTLMMEAPVRVMR